MTTNAHRALPPRETPAARPWPDVAIPPGETLAETLETLKMSQAELARRAKRPVQAINEIVRGKKEITAETALALEAVLGVPAHVWMRLESDYRLTAARLKLKAARPRMPRRRGLGTACGTRGDRRAAAKKKVPSGCGHKGGRR